MINLQKRYILSALFAGIGFIILYLPLDFKIIPSLLITTFLYIAGIFLFKSKDIRVYDAQAISKYYFELSKLNNYKEKIKDKKIKERIKNIVFTCDKLVEYLKTKPVNATAIYNSLDYYLSFSDKRLNEYLKADNKKDKTFTENQLILKMSVYLKEIDEECKKLYSEVINSKEKNINYEMKMFEKITDIEEGSDEDA